MCTRSKKNYILKHIFVYLVGVLCCCCIHFPLLSNHIIGGNITYECLGNGIRAGNKAYKITMTIYRDCQGIGADFDSTPRGGFVATVTIYQEGRPLPYRFDLDAPRVRKVEPNADPCLKVPDWVCVEEGIYEFNAELPLVNDSYYIVYQRCCRNSTISNIFNPDRIGATYVTELTAEAQRTCNSSPKFKEFPPILLCAGEPLSFDQSVIDTEGDSVVYSFCAPLTGGGTNVTNPLRLDGIAPDPDAPPPYTPVTFQTPLYSFDNPIGVDANFRINPQTGIITGTPNTLGQFVMSVCVSEYRNGQLLSTMQRDFQLNVAECQPRVVARVAADSMGINNRNFFLRSCGNNKLKFINESQDRNDIDSLVWIFTNAQDTLTANTWDANITFPSSGNYTGQLILNPDGLCGDTANIFLRITPTLKADFEFDYDTCSVSKVNFVDRSFSEANLLRTWQWNLGDGNAANMPNIDHLYTTSGTFTVRLEVQDANNCNAFAEKEIRYFPAPEIVDWELENVVGCAPATIIFDNLPDVVNETYQVRWNFGDGNTSNLPRPTHRYAQSGVFTVAVDIVSPIGCQINQVFPALIEISSTPTASFRFLPEQPSNLNPNVTFINESKNAESFNWSIGSILQTNEENPIVNFQDTGLYIVTLIAIHQSGCQDTLTKQLDIEPIVQIYIPNAFSPNADGTNDIFKVEGFTAGVQDFSMTIWNRWGTLVFETNDPTVGWDGQTNRQNKKENEGNYLYVIEFKDARGNAVQYKGNILLIR